MCLYFDITDLLKHARKNGTVSGIQRVQIRVLQHLAAQTQPQEILCAYHIGRFRRVRICRAQDLFIDKIYNAKQMLVRLGLENPNTAFTTQELYDDLANYKNKSLKRALRKVKLLILGKLRPDCARSQMNLGPLSEQNNSQLKTIETWPHKKIQKNDHVVMIGTNWNISAVETLAKKHFRRGGKVSQVIYDLIPYRYPEFCIESLAKKFSTFLDRSPSFVSQYICISEATRIDLQKYLTETGNDKPTISWPLAHEFEGYGRNEISSQSSDSPIFKKISKPFVLCVGTIEVRKNGAMLLAVWQQLQRELGDKTPQLVFAGKYGWKILPFQERLRSDPALQRRVTVVDRVTDDDLAELYKQCLFSVFPSLVEGWGLPVGEAAWFGKFSIVSSASSIPEVCGNLVDYIEPNNIDEWVQAIKRTVLADQCRQQREKIICQSPLRLWKDVAADLKQILDN
jgi:glycosyltransferase involved in cell wall biosynthesis